MTRGCWPRSSTCPDSRLLLRACHEAGFEPQIAFQNDDYQAILGFVAAGVGVALIPDMVARGVRDDVVMRELEPPAAAPPDPGRAAPRISLAGGAGDARRAPRGECDVWVANRPVLAGA